MFRLHCDYHSCLQELLVWDRLARRNSELPSLMMLALEQLLLWLMNWPIRKWFYKNLLENSQKFIFFLVTNNVTSGKVGTELSSFYRGEISLTCCGIHKKLRQWLHSLFRWFNRSGRFFLFFFVLQNLQRFSREMTSEERAARNWYISLPWSG